MRIDTPAEVRAAALRAVNVARELKRFISYRAVATQLGFDYGQYFNVARSAFPEGGVGYAEYDGRMREAKTFDGRVDRAMLKLAEQGKIRRSPRGGKKPGGGTAGETSYWTPEAWAEAAARAEAVQAANAVRAATWDMIQARLIALDVDPVSDPGKAPKLGPESWDYLLTAAETWHAANE